MEMEHKFDLQLFAEGGPDGDDGNEGSGSAGTGGNAGGESGTGGTAGGESGSTGNNNSDGNDAGNSGANAPENNQGAGNTGTILGGKADGANDVPEAYDFRSIVPDGMQYDEKSATAFSAVAKEMNLTQEQASKLASFGMNYMSDGVQAAAAQRMAEWNAWGDHTKTELGADYNAVIAKAASGIEALSQKIPGIRQALNETGAGNRIEFVRAFAALGELTSEDSFRGFGQASQNDEIYGNTDFSKY